MSRKFFLALSTSSFLGWIMIGCSSNTALFQTASSLSGSGPIIDISNPTIETNTQYQARLRTELAAGYYSRKQYQVALEEVNNALSIDPKYGPAYGMLALIHSTLGDSIGAEKAFVRATEVAPRDPDIRNNFGAFLCERQRFKESLSQFEIALRNPLYQTPQVALRNAAECASKGGETQRAALYYRQLGQPIPEPKTPAPTAQNTPTDAAATPINQIDDVVTAAPILPATPSANNFSPITTVAPVRPAFTSRSSGTTPAPALIVPAPRFKAKPASKDEQKAPLAPSSSASPTSSFTSFEEAAKAYAQGDLLKAQEWINQAVKAQPVSPDTIHLAMCIERRFANASGEERYADILLSRYPKSPQTSLLNHTDKGCS